MTELRFPLKGYALRRAGDGDMRFVTDCIRDSVLSSVPETERKHSGLWIDDILGVTSIAIGGGLMGSEVFVLCDGSEERIGMLWMGTTKDQFTCEETGYLLGIFIIKEFRGKGLGKALMACAEDWCAKNDLLSLTLNVGSVNGDAKRMYEHSGFEPRSVVMRKRLR